MDIDMKPWGILYYQVENSLCFPGKYQVFAVRISGRMSVGNWYETMELARKAKSILQTELNK